MTQNKTYTEFFNSFFFFDVYRYDQQKGSVFTHDKISIHIKCSSDSRSGSVICSLFGLKVEKREAGGSSAAKINIVALILSSVFFG